MKKRLTLLILMMSFSIIYSQNRHEQRAETYLSNKGEITFSFKVKSLNELKDFSNQLSIVNVDKESKTVKAWANDEQFETFLRRNIPFEVDPIDNEAQEVLMTSNSTHRASTLTFPLTAYPTYADYAQQMADFAADNPSICELVDIGGTGEGVGGGDKRLLFIKLSDNVSTQEQEPRVMYTSSMHGDEIAGYPMMLNLIDYFITAYNDVGHSDHIRVKNLLDTSEVWINPSANPDGTYYNSASNTSVANARRGNVNGIDLNRNYPDPSGVLHPDGQAYQVETLNFMALAESKHFVISANFHGGTEVVNYPWDYTYDRHPDDDWWIHICSEYANNVQADGAANGFPNYFTDINNNGITHGADWYLVNGGRQDYMNFENQAKETTIELSNIKTPSASLLDDYWFANKEGLIEYLIQGTYGFRGVVKDAVTGNPIEATVKMVGHDDLGSWAKTELPLGDYYRPIKAGTYDIIFESPCYQSVTLTGQTISDYQTLTLADVMLTPIGAVAPSGLAASSINATTATLSWDAISGSTYDLRYREIGSPTWIVNAETNNNSSLTGLTASTDYEAQVRSKCTGGTNSAYSSSVNFTTLAVQINYCTSSGNTSYQTGISRVIFGTIDNIDGPAKDVGYEDFTNISTTVTQSISEDLTVYVNTDGNYRVDTFVWIDWNQNGDFTDSGEAYDLGNISNVANGAMPTISVTIPETSQLGSTRMRVSTRYNANSTSCQTNFDGEVEDYTVIVESNGPDIIIPVIALNGASNINLNVGDTYTELGATATDDTDGDITANIVTAGDTVDTNVGGAYVVTYNVSDAAGNNAVEVIRTVNVIPDTTIPVITLNGASTISLNVGDTYLEPGATATDNIDGDITVSIIVGGDIVDTNSLGVYLVAYNVSDTAGNNAVEVIRTVNVIPDTTIPVITLTGNSTIDLDVGGIYTEQGATASDNIDGDISASIVIGGDVVNTSIAGGYVVTYNVSDAAGNNAVEVTRTVTVAPDITIPVITLIGSSTIDLDVGGIYTEQGATASDNIDGDISASIVIGGDVVNTSAAGAYVVTYNVSDAAGNNAVEVTRAVNVIPDTTDPIITLIGSSTIDLDVGGIYTEQGATASDNIDGDISTSIVIGGDVVNTSIVGVYVITYNVSDAAGNNAEEVTRTVNINEIANGCSGGISAYPYNEGFEGSIGAWSQSSADNLDWILRSGTTPSNNTGPSSATQGSNYIYVEASGNGTGYPNKRAIITSPCFDLGNLTIPELSFSYHMYGASDMGMIDLELSDDEGMTWTSIWSQSGNQGNAWLDVNLDISAYVGGGIQVRFNRFVGSTWQADIAIDDFSISEPVAPTCSDGIQNGDETGIDCGGSTCDPCTSTNVTLHQGYFETGWDGWVDGGSDALRYSGANSYEGSYSIRLRDNTNSSTMTLSNIDVTPYSQVVVDFHFYVLSMENGEDFWLQFYDGSSYITAQSWVRGSGIENNNFYNATIILTPSQYNFAANSGFRFRCDASGNQDYIYIDQVTITGTTTARFNENNLVNVGSLDSEVAFEEDFRLYPNPIKGNILNVELPEGEIFTYRILNIIGQIVSKGNSEGQVNVGNLESGMYFIEVNDEEEIMTRKFIKE